MLTMESLQNGTQFLDAETIVNLTDPILAEQWIFTEADDFLYKFVEPIVTMIGVLGNSAFLRGYNWEN